MSDVPCLPSDELDPAARAEALEARRDDYRFVHDWPKDVATSSWLPERDEYSVSYSAKAVPTYVTIGANYAELALKQIRRGPLAALKSLTHTLSDFDGSNLKRDMFRSYDSAAEHAADAFKPETWQDYAEIYCAWDKPGIVDRVTAEATHADAIAWQRIAGVNPMVLTRITEIPEGFAVTDAHVLPIAGVDLETLLAQGRAFITDYRMLEGVPCGTVEGEQKYLAGPIALFAAVNGQLRSVAVQVGSDPRRFPVVTPAEGWAWRMACQCLQVADANHHEGSSHLGRTHMVMEATTIAMKRELAPNHPLAVLLEPHTETTLAIDHSAKTSLIARGGTVDTVFAAKIAAFGDFVHSQVSTLQLDRVPPRIELADRGLDDRDILPVHPYRDDIVEVWDAIESWVSEYVALYYAGDAEVLGDVELQAFARALGSESGGRLQGVPDATTVAGVTRLMATLVFIASAQHSAVNFPQFDNMSYSPNMAGALFAKPPEKGDEASEHAFFDMLPPAIVMLKGASMVYLLSNVHDTKLGNYRPDAFTDPRVVPLVARFQSALKDVEANIDERDASRWLSYPYLKPSNILQSISI